MWEFIYIGRMLRVLQCSGRRFARSECSVPRDMCWFTPRGSAPPPADFRFDFVNCPCLQTLLMLLNPLVARGNRGCGQLKVICGYCQSPRARGNPLLRPPMYGQTKCNFSTHCPTEMNICLDAPEGWIPNMIHELTHVRQCCDKSWINMECDNIIRLEREAFLVARQCDPASRLPNSLTNCCVRACQSAGDACPSQAVCRAKCLAMFP